MQGAMYHIEQDGVMTPMGDMVTEMFVYFDEHGLNIYYVEDDFLVMEPYTFADERHLEALREANFKGLLEFDVNRRDGHPILTEEARRQWRLDEDKLQMQLGTELIIAFQKVVDTFMGSNAEAKAQALAWLEEQYDPEFAQELMRA